ncbi:sulfite exporter TauE/SafE family protein [Bacilliculturomica massiliensis]|uniref:sulfite exporter TauE/SafE family protein n=1 Tax=Bacilliculturomica massiliensis TaxID=1917867 RepID=UPI00102F6E71|nr:sulfite exporter TauE/SafE family protein [Bacilliculturomica massiliensis]
MTGILLFSFTLCATALGGIAGLGGGILIKPFLDFMGLFSVEQTNLISGITVLSMTSVSMAALLWNAAWSVVGGGTQGAGNAADAEGAASPAAPVNRTGGSVDMAAVLLLSAGSVAGGAAGNRLFSLTVSRLGGELCSVLQSALLLLTVLFILWAAIKERNTTLHKILRSNGDGKAAALGGRGAETGIGLVLGLFSSFLGIGGGPVNVIVLRRLFALDMKAAARTSLYLIFFAQAANLAASALVQGVHVEDKKALAMFMAAGIMGGMIGKACSGRISEGAVRKTYLFLLGVILVMVCATLTGTLRQVL